MITRFAPSPTGPLHLGHAYSALYAYDLARKSGGTFLLRIEDIDQSRARPEWETQIYKDLEWLGIEWELPVMRQSERLGIYDEALITLWKQRLIYECSCKRRDIQEALSAPQEGVTPVMGPDGVVYPGICRNKNRSETMPKGAALRLDIRKALQQITSPIGFEELVYVDDVTSPTHEAIIDEIGDIVVARKEMGTSYHLSVVIDDAAQGITDVVRGEDLFEATAIHVVLQRLLNLPTPRYHHHRLIRDENGKRLAKRDDARAISKFREEGYSPADFRRMVSLPAA